MPSTMRQHQASLMRHSVVPLQRDVNDNECRRATPQTGKQRRFTERQPIASNRVLRDRRLM